MAFSLVSAGALASAAGASVATAYGQPTTVGSLAVCCALSTTNTAFSITGPTGWVNITGVGSVGQGRVEIWYKSPCAAGETAPTVNCSLATLLDAEVTEWQPPWPGGPLDTSGTATNLGASLTVTTSGLVGGGGGGLAISIFGALASTPASGGWTPGAGWTNLANDYPSFVIGHFASDYLLNPPTQVGLSETGTATGFTPIGMAACLATFLQADVPITYARGAN